MIYKYKKKKINLSGLTAETVTGVLFLLLALVNTTLQMFGIDALPIQNENVNNIVSTVFLIITALWNTWKNRNITTIAQKAQSIADSVRSGEILEIEVKEFINNFK